MGLRQFLRPGRAAVRVTARVAEASVAGPGGSREATRGPATDGAAGDPVQAPAHTTLFVAVAEWVDSFEGVAGRPVTGTRATISRLECESWSTDVGQLAVDGVVVGVSVAFGEGGGSPLMTVTAHAVGGEVEGSVEMVVEGGAWVVMPGRRLALSASLDERNAALDAALVPTLLAVAARRREAVATRGDGRGREPRDAPSFADAQAVADDASARACEEVARYAGDLVHDLGRLPVGAPARSLLRAAGELARAARTMAGDDGFRGDPGDREHDDLGAGEALGAAVATGAPTANVDGPHRLYAVEDVRRAMEAGGDEASSRMTLLRRLSGDHGASGRRALVVADAATIERVDALARRAPHLAEVSAIARRHAAASMNAGTPLTLPPLVLLGDGGVGKTWFLSRLGEALGVPFRGHPLSGSTLSEALQGSHAIYRNAHAGLVANTLLNERVANPLVFIDEFDKPARGEGDAYRPFYVLLEPEGARRFADEYLGFDVDASRVMWAVAANDLSQVPSIVLDRMTVVETPLPTEDQMLVICDSIAAEVSARDYAGYFELPLRDEVRHQLARLHPRGARKALGHAMTTAASEGRREVRASDVPASGARRESAMGFIRHGR